MRKTDKDNKMFRSFRYWQLFAIVIFVSLTMLFFTINDTAGFVMLITTFVYAIIIVSYYFIKRPSILKELVQFGSNYSQAQKSILKELRLPYAILDYDGKMLWANDELYDIIKNERKAKNSIGNVFQEVKKEDFPKDIQDVKIIARKDNKDYKIILRKLCFEDTDSIETMGGNKDFATNTKDCLVSMFVYDITEINQLKRKNENQKMIVGLLYIDNYDEIIGATDDVKRSLLAALIDRKINKYMQNIDAIIKKLEKDKYIFVFKQKYLQQLQNNKFSLLEEVRNVNIGNTMSVTTSIAIGIHQESYTKAYDYCIAAMDLALGRGGDQAVIKSGDRINYYGGKSVQVEKTTRVKAHALKELIETRDNVVVMGHTLQDVDSFGASVGVFCIARALNKKAHIVINEVTYSVRPFMTRFIDSQDYEEDMFVNNQQALDVVDNNTVLVVVDVNKAKLTECEELLTMTNTIVLLDHHRQSGEAITNASLSYVEPYASSTCEMVAEILQYIGDGIALKPVEADSMYAGIMVDTNNFLTKTGVRTFEAAAFLKRNGADVTRIRKAFRSDMDEYRLKALAMGETEIFIDSFAITSLPKNDEENPTIIGAQVANELLNIIGVKASFVLSEYNHKIYVSARSIDEVNVQVIMEKLGGGGHLSSAGTQFEDTSMEEAMNLIKETLKTMSDNGDL
ncbi:MAG TPA: DHH family phosphoesterase [Clostridiales bacterium]|nr:DHH family phosphoesterase [Clostridiales bacterium]